MDDARHLLSERPPRGGTSTSRNRRGLCYYCLGDGQGIPHEPDCLWASAAPRIIAMLEASERLVAAAGRGASDCELRVLVEALQ